MTAPRVAVTVVEEDDLRVVQVGPMGPYNNNAIIVADTAAKKALLVDMPLDEEPLLEAITTHGGVDTIVATHWHPDHWMTYDAVRAATSAPVVVGAQEISIPDGRIDRRVEDGDDVSVGSHKLRVIHTPGHTPGSISLLIGRVLISGDTLFKGGPGKTFNTGDLEPLLASIHDKLLPLDDGTIVIPGHGESTTIAESRAGYAEYEKHPKPQGFFGNVAWAE